MRILTDHPFVDDVRAERAKIRFLDGFDPAPRDVQLLANPDRERVQDARGELVRPPGAHPHADEPAGRRLLCLSHVALDTLERYRKERYRRT